MTTLHMEAGVLLAESVNTETREIPFTALRFGEVGRTNLGRIIVDKGAFSLPEDVENTMQVNLDHDQTHPLGRVLMAEERTDTIDGVLRIAKGADGDALLARYAANDPEAPRAVSLEVRDIVLRAGRAVAGIVTGLAITKAGAFPSASLFAADAGEVDEPAPSSATVKVTVDTTELVDAMKKAAASVDPTTPDEAPASEDTKPDGEPDEEKEEAVADATASEVMLASRAATPEKKETGPSRTAFFRMVDEVMGGRASAETRAFVAGNLGAGESGMFALSDVDYDGAGGVGAKMTPAQWIGEVPTLEYVPVWADLFAQENLTSLSLGGWKWGTKPTGGTWTGNKDAIPSNTPTVTPVTDTATRWAGGHDIAREHRDFGTPGFFESYNAAMRNSYEQWKDTTIVRTEVLAGATDIEADDPTGLTIGAGWSALIDGASQVIANGYTPTFAQVELSLWKSMMKVPNSDTLGYLEAALNLESGTLSGFSFRPVTGIPTGHIIVGSRAGGAVYQLPGSPIRAEAQNIANGGIDVGLFGYAGFLLKDAAAIVDVAPYTP